MATRTFTAILHKEGSLWVAECPEVGAFSPFSANRCSSSTILEAPTLQALQLGSENPEKRL
jgi:hypothetical protein